MPETSNRTKPERPVVRSIWNAPFQWIEWCLQWMVYWFKGIALFEFLEYMGKLTILFGVVAYLVEGPERHRRAEDEKKRAQYEAWLIINSAKGESGDGGRRLAIRDLHDDGVSLLGLAADDAYLEGLDLTGTDFRHAHFRAADLQKTKLGGSNLKNALMHNADLRGADLSNVSLVGADLRKRAVSRRKLEGRRSL